MGAPEHRVSFPFELQVRGAVVEMQSRWQHSNFRGKMDTRSVICSGIKTGTTSQRIPFDLNANDGNPDQGRSGRVGLTHPSSCPQKELDGRLSAVERGAARLRSGLDEDGRRCAAVEEQADLARAGLERGQEELGKQRNANTATQEVRRTTTAILLNWSLTLNRAI